jgi:hypothetical protein
MYNNNIHTKQAHNNTSPMVEVRKSIERYIEDLRSTMEPLFKFIIDKPNNFINKADQRWFELALTQLKQQILILTVVGEIKVGKSTLINGLVNQQLLETDAVECTSAPTWLRSINDIDHSSSNPTTEDVFVTLSSGEIEILSRSRLKEVSTLLGGRAYNDIERVELYTDSTKFPKQFVLVDTPGLNGNPDLEKKTLHQIALSHVVLYVLAANQSPGSESDLQAIQRAYRCAGKMLLIVNKSDCISIDSTHRLRDNLLTKLNKTDIKLCGRDVFFVSGLASLEQINLDKKTSEYLNHEMFRFYLRLQEGFDEEIRLEILKQQPKIVIQDICRRITNQLNNKLASIESDACGNISIQLQNLKREMKSIDDSCENLLKLIRLDAFEESSDLAVFAKKKESNILNEILLYIEQLSDNNIQNNKIVSLEISQYIQSNIKKSIIEPIRRSITSFAQRITRELTQTSSRLSIEFSGIESINIALNKTEQESTEKFSDYLIELSDKIKASKAKVNELSYEQTILQERIKKLQQQVNKIPSIRAQHKDTIRHREALGLKPIPIKREVRVPRTRRVERSGFLGWIADFFHTKYETVYDYVLEYDYANVHQWERNFEIYRSNELKLEAELNSLQQTNQEYIVEQANLSKLKQKIKETQNRCKRDETELQQKQSEMYKANVQRRRLLLKNYAKDEIVHAIDEIAKSLQKQFDKMINAADITFRQEFKKRYTESYISLENQYNEKLRMIEQHNNDMHIYRSVLNLINQIASKLKLDIT